MSQLSIVLSFLLILVIGVIFFFARKSDNMALHEELAAVTARSKDDPPTPTVNLDDALSRVVWLNPKDNLYNMRVLDCRPVATTMISWTEDASIGKRFAETRQSNGEEYRGQQPPNPETVVANLKYPQEESAPDDGALFLAEVMEDKWDIFLHDGYLYFTRSWTGDLQFRAKIEFGSDTANVSMIEANSQLVNSDPNLAIREVDFLIKSHLYEIECPHPVPSEMKDQDIKKIAVFSFQSFGRRGFFASFEDTTSIRVP